MDGTDEVSKVVAEAGLGILAFTIDLGGHRWFTKNEDLNSWFRRLMDKEVIFRAWNTPYTFVEFYL